MDQQQDKQQIPFTPETNKMASGRYVVAITLASSAAAMGIIFSVGALLSKDSNFFQISSEYLQLAKEVIGFYLGMKVGEIVAKAQSKQEPIK